MLRWGCRGSESLQSIMDLPGIVSLNTALHGVSDTALWQPLIDTARLLVQKGGNKTSLPGISPPQPAISLPMDLLIWVAAAARQSGNLGLAERLIQECSRIADLEESAVSAAGEGVVAGTGLRLAVHKAELCWAQGTVANDGDALKSGAVRDLLSSLTKYEAGLTSGQDRQHGVLRAKAWLQLHRWLPHTPGLTSSVSQALASPVSLSLERPTDDAAVGAAHNALHSSLLLGAGLTGRNPSTSEASGGCIRAAVRSDPTNAEAWRCLGDWLYNAQATIIGPAESGDALGGSALGQRALGQHALAAYCKGLMLCSSRLTEVRKHSAHSQACSVVV